jgi:hypothetical protein
MGAYLVFSRDKTLDQDQLDVYAKEAQTKPTPRRSS